jgi:hypothetical protein
MISINLKKALNFVSKRNKRRGYKKETYEDVLHNDNDQ